MTGLRRSELCGLQWPDIDLDAGVLSVKRARVQIDGGKPITKGPKSAASRRVVDFDTETSDILRAWKVAQLELRLLAGTAWTPGEWIFTNEVGRPHNPEWVGKRFRKLIAHSDLPTITLTPISTTTTANYGEEMLVVTFMTADPGEAFVDFTHRIEHPRQTVWGQRGPRESRSELIFDRSSAERLVDVLSEFLRGIDVQLSS